jgi:hypothetical protein
MNSAAASFERTFVGLASYERPSYVSQVVSLNSENSGITNLLANIDMNYNPKDVAARNRADNIHFVAKMLRAFPDFKVK